MRDEIIRQLAAIKSEHNVKILYACESGSRAWGFPSADSDYDARFIYVRPKEWYLRVDLEACRDVIELPINDLLDINGWDLKKALLLLKKSNPSLIEWLSSPIVYQSDELFLAQINKLSKQLFNPLALFHHYRSMANGNFREHLKGEQVRVKKYFYVLRPILSMRWILTHKTSAPIVFQELVENIITDQSLKTVIYRLIEEKKAGFESDYREKIPEISQYIEEQLAELNALAEDNKRLHNGLLGEEEKSAEKSTELGFSELNDFFLAVLNQELTP
ncbi:nucleotidyltransferase domain-containing protein [Sessilibacter corallicola]|uniref:Nucleotidyltransferase domain-containing protein n=1 Tax=Sessilibacter corallicola TaxID=2904075 RepID=A0ABQ0A4P9_9GAMM